MRRSHPKKEIEAVLAYAEKQGWLVKPGKSHGHAWGRMYCPYNDAACRCGEFCITNIWSTPRNAGNHAYVLKRLVDNCTTHPINAAAAYAAAEAPE
ncbi:hypothetical protein AB4Y42_05235 [Paraburkholderia sp. EG286B]|uniref:hypothetical protein n=1 Tax=Paraburkholderia sp. EG286B TaxID=3237011 RepID=UPI0034D23706